MRMKIQNIRDHLKKFTVGIAGAGGLGSNCAVALARTGIGTLVIADYDVVEEGNLNRQYYFLKQTGLPKTEALKDNISLINKNVTVITHKVIISPENIPEVFAKCDVIVEAFDRKEMKEMLIETVQKKMPGLPVVVGSGLAGWGNSGSIRCRKIDETLYVCGDETTEVSDDMPPLAPRVGVVANLQADTVLEILMKKEH
ncbi:MAG: sulfur carrier protein ThiS adenylyltransferase ThiF [Bacteroidia bacterium]|nr:sulfur carrier protein ThiS adenylyltransferase ThiF [Bacteroidia bacterium]